GAWSLYIAGRWQGTVDGQLATLPPPPANLGSATVAVDGQHLVGWDARFAAALWQLLSTLRARGLQLDLQGLPPGLQQIMGLSLPADGKPRTAPPPKQPNWVARLGAGAQDWWRDARLTLGFVGEVLIALGKLLRGKSDLRFADLAWQLDQTGPRSVPIVSLVSAMVGLILCYMGGAQLASFGAKSFIAELMTVSVVREIAALLTGVILSGRVGAAFAAQLGSMGANDELDALRTLGLDPISHLVLPRVLALLLVSPLLTAFGAVVGMAVAWVAAGLIYGVDSTEYLTRSMQALGGDHLAVGLIKGGVYGVLVAMAGCRQGLYSGRSAEAVGQAVTQSVVKGVVWIVCAASILTVIFQQLGI
ncbi:MAG TPA: ABC transporter permease, partial [Rubrivivax sp.]|nr:ABC transporter permease [Rubrivivax sp.]